MNICFVCSEYPPGPHGGIGAMTQILGRALVAQGHQVRTVGVYAANYPAPDLEDDRGVQILRLRDQPGRFGWAGSRYRLYRVISEWARKGLVDIVEVPDYQGWAAGWLPLPVPVVARLNGSQTYFAAELGATVDRVSFLLERLSLRRANFWCSVSRYTAEKSRRLFGLRAGPDAILYNPVELPRLERSGKPVCNAVVYSGTLTPKKGILSLMKAWPRVSAACPDAELHIFGKDGRAEDGGSMREFILRQLNGSRKTVHFHGHVTRQTLFENLASARMAVFPSYAEAFAIAPLEAMACGCATIYSRRGSGPELLDDGQEGLLIDPDDPERIVEAMVRLWRDRALAERLGSAGRARVNRCFSSERLVSANSRFYEECKLTFRKASNRGSGCWSP